MDGPLSAVSPRTPEVVRSRPLPGSHMPVSGRAYTHRKRWPGSLGQAYRSNMRSGLRLLRLLLLLVLATAVVSSTVALLTAQTGVAEKVVLVGMIAALLYAAARVTTHADRLQARLHRP